jgi:para-nitrobenzyl esterase
LAVLVLAVSLLIGGGGPVSGGAVSGAVAGGDDRRAPTVRVEDGVLHGLSAGDVDEFLGVPFAASPTRDLRFRPPQPVRDWTGTRDATHLPPACLQFGTSHLPERASSEDCLYLNVYRPAGARAGARLPVMTFLHGGGWVKGANELYSGRRMASETGTVVVIPNYRLGALGYLAVPEIGDNAGNFGTLDQIAALKWIQRNIAAFGGDPRSVTVGGQSAGAGSTCSLLTSPLSVGLFARAIVQSGPCAVLPETPLGTAYKLGKDYTAAAGCDSADDVLSCLRARPALALLVAGQDRIRRAVWGTPIQPVQPSEAIAAGDWHKVPVLIGNTAAENKLVLVNDPGPDLTAAEYRARLEASYGVEAAAAILERYPVSAYGTPFAALAAALTDARWACRTAEQAAAFGQSAPTYEYEFDDPTSPPMDGFLAPRTDMSNAHGAELKYLYDLTLVEQDLTAKQQQLARRLRAYWAAFARTGDPSNARLTRWAAVTADSHSVMVLGPPRDRITTTFTADRKCAFWSSL